MALDRRKISKTMAYLLRHDPEGMPVDNDGFADVQELLERLKNRDIRIDRDRLREVVEQDPKGRYELRGDQIRARYGHSIDVEPTFEEARQDVLYHGTSGEAARSIREEGLRPKGRQKVHLSRTVSDAAEVGRRHTRDPVIFEVDAQGARQEGVSIQRASDRIFVADAIPARHLRLLANEP